MQAAITRAKQALEAGGMVVHLRDEQAPATGEAVILELVTDVPLLTYGRRGARTRIQLSVYTDSTTTVPATLGRTLEMAEQAREILQNAGYRYNQAVALHPESGYGVALDFSI